MLRHRRGQNIPILITNQCLGPAGANVNAKQISHKHLAPEKSATDEHRGKEKLLVKKLFSSVFRLPSSVFCLLSSVFPFALCPLPSLPL
jgi:hypothetical protein